ncbi:thiamine-monophosphate kinase [alpha proteobacterium U9-1i]|nr:thiamine-monophosphate kinase [alpha proteobacterium U9-1i]
MPADEFDIIKNLFAPLAGEGARDLVDDVALLGDLIVTTDAIVEGVHFLADDPVGSVAKKALRVNLSDIAAKGAKPVGALLTLIWPQQRPSTQIADFARALAEDLLTFNVPLLGGDTTSTPGPLTISITAFGKPLGASTPSRSDAKPGDHLWVTGVIGDAYLGLLSLTATPEIVGASASEQMDAHALAVRAAYRTPSPPMSFAGAIAAFARASMDVSDGLVTDAGKLASASGVAIRIDAEAVPLSAAGHAHLGKTGTDGLIAMITGGDDYQALFTAAPEARGAIMQAARESGTNVSLIGDVFAGAGVRVVGAGGVELRIPHAGHSHRLGR